MKKGGHYEASGLIEAQFEQGSRGRVLRNLLGDNVQDIVDKFNAQDIVDKRSLTIK